MINSTLKHTHPLLSMDGIFMLYRSLRSEGRVLSISFFIFPCLPEVITKGKDKTWRQLPFIFPPKGLIYTAGRHTEADSGCENFQEL